MTAPSGDLADLLIQKTSISYSDVGGFPSDSQTSSHALSYRDDGTLKADTVVQFNALGNPSQSNTTNYKSNGLDVLSYEETDYSAATFRDGAVIGGDIVKRVKRANLTLEKISHQTYTNGQLVGGHLSATIVDESKLYRANGADVLETITSTTVINNDIPVWVS